MLGTLWVVTFVAVYAAWRETYGAASAQPMHAMVASATAHPDLLAALLAARARVAADGTSTDGREATHATEADGPTAWQQSALQLMRLEAEAGNYAEAHRLADAVYGEPQEAAGDAGAEPPPALAPTDAVRALVDAAGASRVVMINEAHHVPQHRAFTLALLHALRSRGFTHFAAETLDASDSLLGRRGYPTPRSGAYLDEPLYGDLVRTALRLGYRVVPYEAPRAGDPAQRERDQAANLAERVLRGDPHARVLVHAGYGHVRKAPTSDGLRPMALVLRELTGLDPFTIDQTEMTEHSATDYEAAAYRRAAGRLLDRPTVFTTARGTPWSHEPAAYDATVFHPRTRYRDGRPTWLRLETGRVAYALARNVCGRAERCLVEARAAQEGDDAVPVDRVEVTVGHAPPALLLPPGDYRLRVVAPAAAPRESRVRVPTDRDPMR